MIDQLITHHPAVYVTVLQIALLARSFGCGDPAMQFKPLVL
ncbi:Uncharacterised protein [Vibrio cholerae]|nr:Uncharacterised protein [Vibrio cholerae]CSH95809.1 Uncharacterised protein [Vibrio cholerae]CSI67688.1 Uncharacterised protein [Vibrio cholerae]